MALPTVQQALEWTGIDPAALIGQVVVAAGGPLNVAVIGFFCFTILETVMDDWSGAALGGSPKRRGRGRQRPESARARALRRKEWEDVPHVAESDGEGSGGGLGRCTECGAKCGARYDICKRCSDEWFKHD